MALKKLNDGLPTRQIIDSFIHIVLVFEKDIWMKKIQPEWDLIVVGGGPAGLSAAQYGSRANLRTLVIEELAPGGTALLINEMENYPLPKGDKRL